MGEKGNKYLRTKNVLLNELNKEYYVTVPFTTLTKEERNTYLIYEMPEGGGLDYLFGVKKNGNNSVVFNDTTYTDIKALLDDAEKYNSTLEFPPRCYDPNMTEWAREEMKILNLLRTKMGFKQGSWNEPDGNSYKLKNEFGTVLSSIRFEMNHDNGGGKIFKNLGKDSWIATEFKDANDAVKIINSIITGELVSNIYESVRALNCIGINFSNLDGVREYDTNYLISTIVRPKYFKDSLIPKLETLIEKLKEFSE